MFRQLRHIVERMLGRRPPEAGPLPDPFAGVRQPRGNGPGGRQSGVALREPEPDRSIEAVGRAR